MILNRQKLGALKHVLGTFIGFGPHWTTANGPGEGLLNLIYWSSSFSLSLFVRDGEISFKIPGGGYHPDERPAV